MADNTDRYRILMLTGEVSGDMYGAKLFNVLRENYPGLEIFGVGGTKMKDSGMKTLFDSTGWGTIGIIEALKKAPMLLSVYFKLKKILSTERIDCVVAIDYPGFNMSIVRAAKKMGIPAVYYFPPAKWAQKSREVREAARKITKVCATFEPTRRVYDAAGADVVFVGHPIVDECVPSRPREEIIAELGLDPARPIISLLPGSREKEVDYLLPVLLETGEIISHRLSGAQFVVPLANATHEILESQPGRPLPGLIDAYAKRLDVRKTVGKTIDVLSISTISIVASGTATLEAAYLKVPMVIVYKVSLITELLAKAFTRLPPYFGLPNLVLGRKFIPEIIQGSLEPAAVADEVIKILSNREKYDYIKRCLNGVAELLGDPGANQRMADIIMDVCRLRPPVQD